jgi:phosphatidylglycerol---prolipoprotein diacylglyceryl transferase
MRQVLFRIPWEGIPWGAGHIPLFGAGVLLVLWVLFGAWGLRALAKDAGKWMWPDPTSMILWAAIAGAIYQAPQFGPKIAPEGIPLFGYGVMLLLGLVSAVFLAESRARKAGYAPEMIWDLATSTFIPGILGARIFYLVQHGDKVFHAKQTVPEMLFAAVNLSEGGLVLYGGIIAGTVAYFVFCYLKNLPPLGVADIITPSICLGVGFGRIGCLLNGCCFGDACDLPWGIVFPHNSVPFSVLVQRGFLSPDASATPPLHPTQIYSALDGFLTAGLALWYTRYRRVPGDVFGLALLIAPTTRFLIEFLRGDEYGQLGTSLTISQWISMGLLAIGLGLQVYLNQRAKTVMQPTAS